MLDTGVEIRRRRGIDFDPAPRDYRLELAIWPGVARRIVAPTNVRGEWLEWLG